MNPFYLKSFGICFAT